MSKKIGIIADDLTGSNDSGVQFAKKGFTSTVVMDIEKKNAVSDAEVLVIDTDSRAKSSERAYEAVVKAASLLFEQGYSHVYKKVDSTLRGNIALELDALASVYRPDVVVIAPAFPKLNRTTVNGYHYVNGVLINETEFGRDPKTPVTECFIQKLLGAAIKEDVALVDVFILRRSLEEVITFIKKTFADGKKWYVCDAESEADLEMITKAFASINKRMIWAGSGGLVEYLPNALKLKPLSEQQYGEIKIEKTLVVSGSLSQVTKKQIKSLRDLNEVCFIEINPVDLVNHTLHVDALLFQAGANAQAKQLVVYVDSSKENRDAAKEAGKKLAMNGNQVSEAIATGLGKAASAILDERHDINSLILTGGDTAKAVCSELGVSQMSLYGEVEPGLPFGRITSRERTYWAVTKAGGFGNEDSLVKAVNYMTGKVEQYESK
ncbi:four-carbon acid sugar kinase family protein [uncultured Metabacillus sp.]|uniref:four-carbon acid sugar kinase family protein n=1 Tax=uncultured Metabacillus sp. TaxID=2860135 RepID=UPI00262463B0|nr:four-carbon acid sugar kinase family protein [uncultured Metabacillus sp.]